jgi:H+/Cl- antiporter ClcA
VEYYEALMPAFVASCASFVVFAAITHLGVGPTWDFPQVASVHLNDFWVAILYGVLGAAAGWIFVFVFDGVKFVFAGLRLPIYVSTTVGGVILGTLAYFFPATRYFGHEQLNMILQGTADLKNLIAIFFFKIVAIAVTVASGWRGGIIIPLFFVGAVLGKAAGIVIPFGVPALAIVCLMASVNSCVTRTPISTTILLSALTGVHQLAPILFASLCGYFLAPGKPFIEAQLAQDHRKK